MNIRITTDDGAVIGECKASEGTLYRDIILYVSGLWAAQSLWVEAANTAKRAAPDVVACLSQLVI